ncbi:recombination regulator RecX [Corynebacterium ureicelerivorans]|uniref:Regulatory protein RecX n=1 Tax=Corynebacterium ureicelerivorans TaxID=401472 RepID=A0A077HJ21_9CORY|nr:recombination regulator RecX [Corynebacterium ureicelerivorans]AIL97098.1 recombinase RecX [Corynebacterium ureicelerivorans]
MPDREKIARLQAALDAYEPGTGLFDREREEALAPVRKRALGLLDQRARSRSELRERLLKAEFEPQLVDEVVNDLAAAGLVNDAQFASEWVRQRAARRGKSARALDMELRDKGVEGTDRAAALEQISDADEERTARAVAEKAARKVKSAPADRTEYVKHLRRIVGALARRGFNQGMALRIGREALDERIAGCEE